MQHETIPVVVADLVPDVAEQRAVGLMQRRPPPLPLRIVRLGDVDGDDAVGVAGQDRRAAFRWIGEELEGEAAGRILVAGLDRETRVREGVDETTLRGFEPVPSQLDARLAEIRNDAGQAARTERADRRRSVADHLPA
jgi:hypothetical protein